jgi:hypothetical protein
MGSPALQTTELKVQQTTADGLVDTKLHAEVYGSPTAATVVEDHAAGLQAECRPGDT